MTPWLTAVLFFWEMDGGSVPVRVSHISPQIQHCVFFFCNPRILCTRAIVEEYIPYFDNTLQIFTNIFTCRIHIETLNTNGVPCPPLLSRLSLTTYLYVHAQPAVEYFSALAHTDPTLSDINCKMWQEAEGLGAQLPVFRWGAPSLQKVSFCIEMYFWIQTIVIVLLMYFHDELFFCCCCWWWCEPRSSNPP